MTPLRRVRAPRAAAAALALVLALGAAAGPPPDAGPPAAAEASPMVSGPGAAPCEQVVTEAMSPAGLDGRRARAVYQAWAEGFLTALNVEQARRREPVTDQGAMTADAQWVWLFEHCAAYPGERFVEAVASLAGALNRPAPPER